MISGAESPMLGTIARNRELDKQVYEIHTIESRERQHGLYTECINGEHFNAGVDKRQWKRFQSHTGNDFMASMFHLPIKSE